MNISNKEVKGLANLGRLELLEDELVSYTEQLNAIINLAKKIKEIDTSNVKETIHGLDIRNVFREDKVKESLSNERALYNAPDEMDGQFKVPTVIE